MHTVNFYPNFVPIQEIVGLVRALGDRGEAGVLVRRPRAVYLGSGTVPPVGEGPGEWGQGPGAMGVLPGRMERPVPRRSRLRISEDEKGNLRWEAPQFRAGRLWHRWI